jgi:hypothetical protein
MAWAVFCPVEAKKLRNELKNKPEFYMSLEVYSL